MKYWFRRIAACLALSLLIIVACSAAPAQTQTQPANARQSDKYDGDCTGNETVGRCADKPLFDHTQCQYPDRTTNPVDGCDNSDPCDPANTKGGSGDCTPTYTPSSVPPAVVNQCGGK